MVGSNVEPLGDWHVLEVDNILDFLVDVEITPTVAIAREEDFDCEGGPGWKPVRNLVSASGVYEGISAVHDDAHTVVQSLA